MTKINDKIVGEVISLDHMGNGIIRHEGQVIFVDNVMPRDIVEVEITSIKKNFAFAKPIKFIERNINRREKMCPLQTICGGCDLLLIPYNEQLTYKENKVKDIIRKYVKEDFPINNIIHSTEFYYRNKITLHVSGKKIGLYKKNSNDLVEVNSCLLITNPINDLIKRLRIFLEMTNSNIREITVKVSSLNETMLVIYGSLERRAFLKDFSDVTSIILNNYVIHGKKSITEEVMGYKFLISRDSFFQVNMLNVTSLYNEVLRQVENKNYNRVLDLYCGTGTIGIIVSKYAKEVIGIEEVEDAINDARENAKINNITNISFILGKVENNLDKIKDIDLIIVDPPREGLNKLALNNILTINPKELIYVSCDPMTLARDLNILKDTYQIEEINPVDMFPNTYHVECVCVMNRH